MKELDLNCDMGESFGAYSMGQDEEILQYVTSANVACGFHAGDPTTMRKTVKLALQHGVQVGAHPGYPDLVGFGRRNLEVSAEEAYEMVIYQIGALDAFVRAEGASLHHVKPHGAFYNRAAASLELATAIAEAVYRVNPELILYGLSGSNLILAGQKIGLRTASEVFADRTYLPDGRLTPRNQPNALLTSAEEAAKQVIRMAKEGKVLTTQGSDFTIQADTVCIHGDGPHALQFAQTIRQSCETAGVLVRALS